MNDTEKTCPAQDGAVTPAASMRYGEPPRDFSSTDCIFAWLCVLAGYLFCRTIPVTVNPLGGALFVLLLFAVTAIVLKRQGAVFGLMPLCAAGSAIAVAASLILCADPFLHTLAYVYALAAYLYFVYAATGNALQCGVSDLIAADMLRAMLILPLSSFDQLFAGMFSGKAKNSGKVLGRLLAGIAIALIPTGTVLVLLSYDNGFSDLLTSLFDWNFGDLFSHLLSLGFGIVIGMYLFGLYISCIDHKERETLTAAQCHTAAERLRIAPTLTVAVALTPLLLVYVIFFISQWQYYISGFTGVLPAELSYATYAREGFFQLCTVSVINLVMILAALLLMHRTKATSWLLKLLTTVYSLFTLVLISTAVAKMVMYIDYYGLTQKRVYATWFMTILALVFLLVALKQFFPRLKVVALSLAVCVVMFAGLSLCGVNSIIASYNVDRYLDGSLKSVDIEAMEELGDAAVPALVRLYDTLEDDAETVSLRAKLKASLKDAAERLEEDDRGIFSFTVPSLLARQALTDCGMIK